MVEKVYKLTQGNDKVIEKVIDDEHINYMHMILNKGEGLPNHNTNANLYMTVLRGTLEIGLDGLESNTYEKGSILNIPMGTLMDARNMNDETLELTVIKAPKPEN